VRVGEGRLRGRGMVAVQGSGEMVVISHDSPAVSTVVLE